MALAPISRATTVTVANPTPPTNVVTPYQGTPPTKRGLVGNPGPPIEGPVYDVTDANIYKFADPTVGAVVAGSTDWVISTSYVVGALARDVDLNTYWRCAVANTSPGTGTFADYRTANPTHWVAAGVTELAGLAEGDGTEAVTYNPPGATAANDWSSQRATDGNYSETPNASHPSYNSRAK